MKIDMRPILSGETDVIDINTELIIPDEYDIGDLNIEQPIHLNGRVTNYDGYIELSLNADVRYIAECSRCLTSINDIMTMDFNKTVASQGVLQNEDNDDYVLIEEGMLDITVPLTEQLLLEFPSKQLCDEDCRGLCQKCGRNLNEGDCGCDHREIDPRLAVLQQFLDNDSNENK